MIENPSQQNVEEFYKLYKQTMVTLNARNNYYFSKKYFSELLNIKGVDLFIVKHADNIIGASIFITDKRYTYYFLSGSDKEYSKYYPVETYLINAIEYYKSKGSTRLHLGGGSKSLKEFKQRFANDSIPYYIGIKIINKEIYGNATRLWEQNKEYMPKKYYPSYRA